jgi:hypothetical protein
VAKQKAKMNTQYRRVPAEFGPETRFDLTPAPPAPFRAVQENRFEQLKSTLVGERLETLWKPELSVHVRRAANEAAALAWVTRYPLLVFPVLFDEKTAAALLAVEHQEQIRQRSRELYPI